MFKKLIAEVLGTMILVLFGCGSAVLMGNQIGMTGIALAFGLAFVAAAYGLGASPGFAGLATGLTLAAIHLVGINVTGVSVNPARSIGPALFVGDAAMSQLWLFIVAPLAGGAAAGIVHRLGLTSGPDPLRDGPAIHPLAPTNR